MTFVPDDPVLNGMGRKGKKRSGSHGGKARGQAGAQRDKKNIHDQLEGPVVVKKKSGPTLAVPGLSNLGNTCFFNAVMQCIGQSHYFKERLELHVESPMFSCELRLPATSEEHQTSRKVKVEDKLGELTTKLNTFLSQMRSVGGTTLNPKPVFSEICRKAPRFSGYHQQDSQELLRYLLDSLRSEEIFRIKKALLLSYHVDCGKAKVTEVDRKEIRMYGIQAQLARTFVDDVFAGRLVSTVVCQECGNCSTIYETFLDLSLPIADDKSLHGQQSGRDYKRNKGGKKPLAIASQLSIGVEGEDNDKRERKSPPLPVEKTLSKHQQKKARIQKEKAAKKEAKFKAKKQQTLQEFLTSPSEAHPTQDERAPTEPRVNSEEEQVKAESEMGGQSLKGEEEREREGDHETRDHQASQTDRTDSADVSTSPNDGENIDPATGEPQTVSIATNKQNEEENREQNAQDSTFMDYASAGPQPDLKEVTELLGGINLTENEPSGTVEENQGREEVDHGGEEDQSVSANEQAAPKEQQVPSDSLEGSLKRFCTPELLTGSNKFACSVCTREKAGKATPLEKEGERGGQYQKEESEDVTSLEEKDNDNEDVGELKVDDKDQATAASVSESHSESKSDTQECLAVEEATPTESEDISQVEEATQTDEAVMEEECSSEATRRDGSGDQREVTTASPLTVEQVAGVGEEGSGELAAASPNSNKQDNPDNGEEEDERENILPFLEENESEGGSEEMLEKEASDSASSVVFSEAMKQFLIEHLPLVLTLNLKRFIQHGRRLQKNSRHISFPTLLNMAPFCTSSCKLGRCDGKGQLLYSLYGVVEHSGGMQGGHYTAYVRTRNPIKDQVKKIVSQQEISQEVRHSNSSPKHGGTGEPSKATAGKVTGSEFDLSSTKGQWYHISDSRVRTAMESEVLKSQAYLLFYEQLPLSHDSATSTNH